MAGAPDTGLGEVLAAKYHLLSMIGQGGSDHVYRARQETTGQLVALIDLCDVGAREAGSGLSFSDEPLTRVCGLALLFIQKLNRE